MPEPIKELLSEEADAPAKVKIGEEEYDATEVASALQTKKELDEWNQQHGDWRSLKGEFTKTKQEIAEIRKTQQKVTDIQSGEMSANELTEQDQENLRYMEKLGVVRQGTLAKLQEELQSVKAELDERKSQDSETARQKRRAELDAEISGLMEQYQFIDKKELVDYMVSEADAGTTLTPTKAARLLYFDKFQLLGVKPKDLPTVEKGGKSHDLEPQAKMPALGSKEMNDYMREKLFPNSV